MPGTNFESDDDDFDAQDVAEALDESNYDLGGENNERRTFEELPDVLDVTSAIGDRDDDEALALDADEFDPEAFDDSDVEEDDELDYRAAPAEEGDDLNDIDDFDEDALEGDEIEGLNLVADADRVTGGEDDVSNFQSKGLTDEDLQRLGYAEPRAASDTDGELDEGLEETFPASDPVSLTRRED